MSRAVLWPLVLLSAVLLALPITQPKPGLPQTLRADEPAYLLAAESLVQDGDLHCDTGDLKRLFDAYPYLPTENLILATTDGWHTIAFGKPYLYSLIAAPLVALWGPNGMVELNLLLVVLILWLGVLHLRRYNDDIRSALFATGFVLWSTVLPYAFWLHPEIFMMAGAAVALFLGIDVAAREHPGAQANAWVHIFAPALSGGALALAAYHKPVIALLGLPVLVALARLRRWRSAAGWLSGAALAGLLAIGGSYLLVGFATPYLGPERAGFVIESPYELPVVPSEMQPEQAERLGQRSAGWGWLFRMPEIEPAELAESLRDFLIGRHTGLVVYQPFALLCLLLFILHGRRSTIRWTLLAAIAGVALFFLLLIPFNWHGGGGFIGNRYIVIVYPAFLFLVTRIAPSAVTLFGWAAGSLVLGPLVLAPLGTLVPEPTLQAHARARAFQLFPSELSFRSFPGHHSIVISDVWWICRKDQVRPIDGTLLVQGADRSELWAQSAVPLDTWVFDLRTQAPHNTVTLSLGDDRQRVILEPGQPQRVILTPHKPSRLRSAWQADHRRRQDLFAYRLVVEISDGELPMWRGGSLADVYLGVMLSFRGSDPGAPDPAPHLEP